MWPTEKASEDRAGLAQRATELARAAVPGVEIEILWDGMWVRRGGVDYFPDPEMFRVAEPDWQRWAGQARKYLRDAADYWFHVYQPQAGNVIVDIGAGRGEDTLAFSRAGGARTAGCGLSSRIRFPSRYSGGSASLTGWRMSSC